MVYHDAFRNPGVPPDAGKADQSYIVRFAQKTADAAYYQDEVAIQELRDEMQRSWIAISEQRDRIRTIIDRLLVPAVSDLNSLQLSYATQVRAFRLACQRVGCEVPDGYSDPDPVDTDGLSERIDETILG